MAIDPKNVVLAFLGQPLHVGDPITQELLEEIGRLMREAEGLREERNRLEIRSLRDAAELGMLLSPREPNAEQFKAALKHNDAIIGAVLAHRPWWRRLFYFFCH